MKKIIVYTLAVMLSSFTLASCSNKADSGSEKKSESPASSGKQDSTVSEESDKFVIGGIGPLTGDLSSYGISVKQGAEYAVDEINASGGLKIGDKTYKVELDFKDDEGEPEKALTAYTSLKSSGINALIGGVTSQSSMAVSDHTKDDYILQVSPCATAEGITSNPNVFRLGFTDKQQAEVMADYVDREGYENIVLFYNESNEYSKSVHDAFVKSLNDKGKGSIISAEETFNDGDNDFSNQFMDIDGSAETLIVFFGYNNEAAALIEQAKEFDNGSDFVGTDGMDLVIDKVSDPGVLDGTIFTSDFIPVMGGNKAEKFAIGYTGKYKETSNHFAAGGYDAVYAAAEAAKKAGSIDNNALVSAMSEISFEGASGEIKFDASGEANQKVGLVYIEDGKYNAK